MQQTNFQADWTCTAVYTPTAEGGTSHRLDLIVGLGSCGWEFELTTEVSRDKVPGGAGVEEGKDWKRELGGSKLNFKSPEVSNSVSPVGWHSPRDVVVARGMQPGNAPSHHSRCTIRGRFFFVVPVLAGEHDQFAWVR